MISVYLRWIFFWWAPEFLFTLARGRFRRSRASKVTDIGANRKRGHDFLLVIVTLALSCTVSEIGHVLCAPDSWPHPYSTLILGCSRCTRSPMLVLARAEALSYSAVKLFSKNSNLFEHGTWSLQTDRRTDRQTTCNLITALCASIAR